jgi:hypothetical protein
MQDGDDEVEDGTSMTLFDERKLRQSGRFSDDDDARGPLGVQEIF